MTTFQRLLDRVDRDTLAPDVVELIHAAGNPFYDWFLGGPARARAAVERLLERPSSEVAASRVTVLMDGDRLAGMYVGVEGADLAVCRKADTLALLQEVGSRRARRALAARMTQSRDLFPTVASDEFYLSKIGVATDLRGRGFGRALLEQYLATGESAGFRRFRLDVAADNAPAIALYHSLGFAIESERQAPGLRYVAMALSSSGAAEARSPSESRTPGRSTSLARTGRPLSWTR